MTILRQKLNEYLDAVDALREAKRDQERIRREFMDCIAEKITNWPFEDSEIVLIDGLVIELLPAEHDHVRSFRIIPSEILE